MKLRQTLATLVLGSLRTKLTLSVTLLVSIIVAFFILSTLDIIQNSNRRQSFDNSWVESKSLGQRFLGLVSQNSDILQGSIQNTAEETAQKTLKLNPNFVGAFAGWIDPKTKLTLSPYFIKAETDVLAKQEIISSHLQFDEKFVSNKIVQLPEKRTVYFRYPIENRKPLIAIVRYSNSAPRPDGMVLYTGVLLSVKNLTQEKTLSEITLLDRDKNFLFSTDFTTDQLQVSTPFQPVLGPRSPIRSWFEQKEEATEHLLGSLEIDDQLIAVFRLKKEDLTSRSTETLGKFIFSGFLFVVFAALITSLIGGGIQSRLKRVKKSLELLLNGGSPDPIQLPSGARDEVDQIAEAFSNVPDQLLALKNKEIEKFKSDSEKVISKAVQQTLIPPERFQSQLMQIYSFYQPASEFSGDWWGFFGVGQKLCLLIGDCTGKGFQSALMTAAVRSCFSVMHKLAIENEEFSYSPGAMLAYANRVIFDTSSGKAAMTLFASVIDFSKGTMIYSSAAHNPPWLFRKEPDGKFSPVSLISRGQRLGEARNVPDYQEETTRINRGDMLFMYTDGLPDAISPNGERIGKMKVRRIVEDNLKFGPEGVCTSLKAQISEFCLGAKPDDDLTFACVEFLPTLPGATKTS